MRTLCAAVLTFESIIVLLSIPVAIVVYGLAAPVGVIGGGVLMSACLPVAGSHKRTGGLTAGLVRQVLIMATGCNLPASFFLGVVLASMCCCTMLLV